MDVIDMIYTPEFTEAYMDANQYVYFFSNGKVLSDKQCGHCELDEEAYVIGTLEI